MIKKLLIKKFGKYIVLMSATSGLLYSSEVEIIKDSESILIHRKLQSPYDAFKISNQEVKSLDALFDNAKPFATFRVANVTSQQELLVPCCVDERRTNETAIGSIFGFSTASFYGLHLDLGAYVSQKVNLMNPQDSLKQNSELLNSDGDSYVYLGMANVAYEGSVLQAKVGRIRLDTPYADSDDIRMSPNSFEGTWAKANLNDRWYAQAYYLTRWAGVDSEEINQFKSFVDGGYGLAGASLSYDISSDTKISLWYYNVDKQSDIIYAEGTGVFDFTEKLHLDWGAQAAHIKERTNSGIAGDVLGAMAIVHYDFFYTGVAYNYVFEEDNKTITDGFGGGPYFTSFDEQTIGSVSALSPGNDLGVYRLVVGMDFTSLGVDSLNLECVHGHFNVENSPIEAIENDVALTYAMSDRWNFETIYANINLENIDYAISDPNAIRGFQRLVTRLDYSF